MDPNQVQANPAPQPAPLQPVVPTPQPPVETPRGGNKKLILLLAVVLVAVLSLVGAGTYYLSSNSNNSAQTQSSQNTYTPTPTVTSVPSEPEITSKDTSDTSLEEDIKVLDKNINNLGSDANSVDGSFSDQQTDLN